MNAPQRAARIVATVSAVAVFAVVVVLAALGFLAGPLDFILLALAWVLVPSARTLSRRLTLNGAIALAFVPVLWWIRIPTLGLIGRVGIITAIACAVVVYLAVANGWRSLVPLTQWIDLVPVALGVGSVVLLWPLFELRSAAASLRMLFLGFGNDNVAHFDMFAMIRSTSVVGWGWPQAPDGTAFAYVNYPQHFHVLAAFFAEAWAGAVPSTPFQEVGLYSFATGCVLVVGVVIFASAILSIDAVGARPGLAALAAVGSVATFILGFGALNLTSGFPGFMLAIVGSVVGVLVAVQSERADLAQFAAVGGTALLVAHCWLLLAPVPAVAFFVLLVRFRWREASTRGIVARVVVTVLVGCGGALAGLLVLRATDGSFAAALSTPGGIVPIPVSVPALLGVVVVLGSVAYVIVARFVRSLQPGRYLPITVLASTATGLGVAAVVVIVQLRQTGELSYYQFKLFNGLAVMLLCFFLVLACAFVGAARLFERRAGRALVGVAIGLFGLVLVADSVRMSAVVGELPGIVFRDGLVSAGTSPSPPVDRIGLASTVAASRVCEQRVYFAGESLDPNPGVSNQWAMALSGTWTEGGAKATSYLFDEEPQQGNFSAAGVPASIKHLLAQAPGRCVTVSPTVRDNLGASLLAAYGPRIVSWSR